MNFLWCIDWHITLYQLKDNFDLKSFIDWENSTLNRVQIQSSFDNFFMERHWCSPPSPGGGVVGSHGHL